MRWVGVLLVGVVLSGCGSLSGAAPFAPLHATASPLASPATPSPSPSASPGETNVYAATRSGFAPAVQGLPPHVYVPNEGSNSVSIIDPTTYKVIGRIAVGSAPQHVTPSWDLRTLYVNDTALTAIDPRTEKATNVVQVAMPYNLYYTPDGSKAIVVAEELHRLDVYDPKTWAKIGSVPVPWPGVDHMDFSADGSYLMVSCEFSGKVAKVDLTTLTVAGTVDVGGLPVDVKLAPAGDVFFVANQRRDGVSVVDPIALKEIGFIGTGHGAHGLAISRDTRSLYVTNRLGGTITVIDMAARMVRANWTVGGSPDMLQVSPDGRELWTANRFSNTVIVVDTETGKVTHTITVEKRPHGLTFFPQPGRFSLGHNGVYR